MHVSTDHSLPQHKDFVAHIKVNISDNLLIKSYFKCKISGTGASERAREHQFYCVKTK